MVGSSSSKILTVSYGTFSCTLEGFDDPFSTMRHIAEYFRDLAADDRYFGAEPPTPDAEMLHRIAEREIQRRVESRVQGDGVVLRQLDSGLTEDEGDLPASSVIADDERPVRQPAPAAEPEPQVTPEAAPEAAPAPETAEAEADTDAADAQAGSVEEKLSRIRAVVERTRSREISVGIAGTAVTEEPDADEEAMVADMSPGFAGDIDASLISQVISEQSSAMPDEDSAPEDAPVWEFDRADDSDDVDEASESHDEDTAVAEDESSDSDETDEATTDEAEPVQFEDEAEPVRFEDEAEPAQAEEAAKEVRAEGWQEEQAAEDTAEDDVHGTESEMSERDDVHTAEREHATDDAIARIMGRDPSPRPADTADTSPLAEDEPEVDADPEIVLELSAEEEETQKDEAEAAVSEAVSEWAEDSSSEEDLFEAEMPDEAETADGDQTTDEAEDDRTLEMSDEADADWQDVSDAEALPKADSSLAEARARRTLSKSSQLRAPEEESPHIETRTETAFRDDAGSRRRSAIAHLRAAVAATRADRILSRVVGRDLAADPEEQKSYREDLSKVVKPREPSKPVEPQDMTPTVEDDDEDTGRTLEMDIEDEAETVSERRVSSRVKTRLLGPEDTVTEDDFLEIEEGDESQETGRVRSTPLMLVSALRVADESRAEARAGRAADDAGEDDDDGAGFMAFAERMGAKDLGDLIEAAAAYSAFVEGKPHFSRPQVMRRVGRIDPTVEESREAALRAFGQLLRQGRIKKLERGQFRVSEATRFNPEARIAGE